MAAFRQDDTWTDVHAFRLRVLVRVVQLQRQWLRSGGAFKSPANLTSSSLAILATVLFASNAISLDRPWPYVTALCLVLLTAALAFQRMIGVRR